MGRERGVDVHHLGALRRIPARHRQRGWAGTRAAWLCIAGFAAVLFNFGVVNVFFTGLHPTPDCDPPPAKGPLMTRHHPRPAPAEDPQRAWRRHRLLVRVGQA